MNEIGGYFELELNKGKEFHQSAIALNSGRNCLAYILKTQKVKRLYYPYYNCESMISAVAKIYPEAEIIFYHIDSNFNPILNDSMWLDDWLLYINYFGICSLVSTQLKGNVIIDNSQSFYSSPTPGQETFYSPRKFFGVPDGGYLYSRAFLKEELKKNVSYKRALHLLKRIDLSASEGYKDFKSSESSLNNEPIMQMSNLTRRILSSLDYPQIAETRRSNFFYLHDNLALDNILSPHLKAVSTEKDFVPFVYPYLPRNHTKNLRKTLINEKIYVAKYWPSDLLDERNLSDIEKKFVMEVLPLPIDQRYGINDMKKILEVING